MKTICLSIFGALLGLTVLWLIAPEVQAEEDWMREAREQREQMERFNREAREQRDAFYNDQKARQQQAEWDDWMNRVAGPGPVAAPPALPAMAPAQADAAGPAGVAAQLPPKGAVPAFRQQIFNGTTLTEVTYYREPSGALRAYPGPLASR